MADDGGDIIAKGMREFHQTYPGTAQTPPPGWMETFIAIEAYNKVRALSERLEQIEARLNKLEGGAP